ncbi:MAG: nuclear transport factor 2 family protein [Pseudomonadota bacterium]
MLPETAAEVLVRRYLEAMAVRDLGAARALLAPRFEMFFPGNVRFTTLEQLIEWSAPRYRHVQKAIACIDIAGSRVAYCSGTLSGQWTDGSQFEGIRFIDRFEIADDRLQRQDVWNDMAEMRS